MADLRISELNSLSGVDLAGGDLLPVVDTSASETKKIVVSGFTQYAIGLLPSGTIAASKITFSGGEVGTVALASGAVTTATIATDAVTGVKLANESTIDLVTSLPGSGEFVGQGALNTSTEKLFVWDGSSWLSIKAAGSVNTITGDTSGVVNLTATTSGDTVTLVPSLDNTGAAAQFLAGPAANSGAVSYRTITGADLPVPTASGRGGVAINGEGLRVDGSVLEIDNDLSASATYSLVTYNAKGLILDGRAITSADLPVATASVVGAVLPGTGLGVSASGVLNHTNSATAGTYTKVTIDSQGHVAAGTVLTDADLPNHSAALLTAGTLDIARVGTNTIIGEKLANYAVSKIGDTQPTADHIGQFFFNPLSRDLFLWDGNVFQPIGISVGEIIFAGTFDASSGGGTGLIASVTAEGTAIGLVVGQALPAAATANNRYYLVVSEAGTITSGNAPQVALTPPDIILSNGANWTEIDVSQTITAQVASNVSFTPAGDIAATNVQTAIEEVDNEKLPKAGGTVTGELLIGTTGSLAFEGASANAYETYLAVVDPTADRTITFPDISGTVITTGDTGTVTSTMIADGTIVNGDINASAAIADTKLATISTAGKVSNSATTATDANTASAIVARDASGNFTAGTITANLSGNASTVTTNANLTGDVTSVGNATSIAAGVIVNADVNASAAIAGTKISPDFGSQTIATTGIVSHALGTAGAPTVTFTGDTNTGIFSPGADQVAISTNGTQRLTTDTAAVTSTLPVVHPLGAAATPSLTFTGDLNTGIYSPGADQVAVATNGTGRLFVDSSGQVGIGGSPTDALFVTGAAVSFNVRSTSSSAATSFKWGNDLNTKSTEMWVNGSAVSTFGGASAFNIYQGAAAPIIVSTNNQERLRITSAGLVGVGTSSPSHKLHVVTDAVSGRQDPTNISRTSGNLIRFTNPQFSADASMGLLLRVFPDSDSRQGAGIIANGGTNNSSTTLDLFYTDTAGTSKSGLRISDTGAVGIGTSSPARLLEVRSADDVLIKAVSTDPGAYVEFADNNTTQDVRLGAIGNALCFDVNSERMRIDSSGRVGIGTTNPGSYGKLAVFGAASNVGQNVSGFFYNPDAASSTICIQDNTSASGGGIGSIGNNLVLYSNSGVNLAERARIDSNGRLLVGTSSSAGGSGSTQYATFQVRGNTGSAGEGGLISLQRGETGSSVANGEALGAVLFASSDGAEFASIIARGDGTSGSNDYPGRIEFSTTADGASSPTERMRIRQNGFTKISSTGSYAADAGLYHEIRSGTNDNIALYVTHAGASGNQYGIEINTANDQNDSTRYFLQCSGGNTNRAKILSNGGLTNYQANNVNLSDINTKKDISPAAGTWDCIKEWEIVNYRYKDQPDDADLNLGVIAQQVAEGCPEVIAVFQEAKEATETEPAQEERLGVKEQQMYWMAIKALQEAQVRIEQLEAKVAALEAQ